LKWFLSSRAWPSRCLPAGKQGQSGERAEYRSAVFNLEYHFGAVASDLHGNVLAFYSPWVLTTAPLVTSELTAFCPMEPMKPLSPTVSWSILPSCEIASSELLYAERELKSD
jgi:hypothetical protein